MPFTVGRQPQLINLVGGQGRESFGIKHSHADIGVPQNFGVGLAVILGGWQCNRLAFRRGQQYIDAIFGLLLCSLGGDQLIKLAAQLEVLLNRIEVECGQQKDGGSSRTRPDCTPAPAGLTLSDLPLPSDTDTPAELVRSVPQQKVTVNSLNQVFIGAGVQVGLGERALLSLGAVTPVTGPRAYEVGGAVGLNYFY